MVFVYLTIAIALAVMIAGTVIDVPQTPDRKSPPAVEREIPYVAPPALRDLGRAPEKTEAP